MEIRRLLFVENGYPIRKLNQAYFAFHGSYGTSAAATSPLRAQLIELRSLTPDVKSFSRGGCAASPLPNSLLRCWPHGGRVAQPRDREGQTVAEIKFLFLRLTTHKRVCLRGKQIENSHADAL
jgi:hypothetical protein